MAYAVLYEVSTRTTYYNFFIGVHSFSSNGNRKVTRLDMNL